MSSPSALGLPPRALEGLRVLDCSGAAGQYAGKLFADLGAEVVLVEPPGGSPVRAEAPFLDDQPGPEQSLTFSYFNSGKRSLVLDLDRAPGAEALRQLATQADLLIETERPGTMARRGLDAARLQQRAPRLTVTSITPFGQTGPCADWAHDDLTVLALGGMLSLAGYPDTAPMAAYGDQALRMGALFGAVASLMAVWAVEGDAQARGPHIDVSMQAGVTLAMENAVQFVDLEGTVRRRDAGQQRQAGNGVFDCADGQVYLMAGGIASNRFWRASAQWLIDEGVEAAQAFLEPPWPELGWLATTEAKAQYAAAFGPFAAARTKAELYRAAQERRIPLCPISTPADLTRSRQLLHRGYFVPLLHAASGRTLTVPGAPYRLAATPWRITRPAPRLGEHSDAVLREAGIDPQPLRAQGVVQ